MSNLARQFYEFGPFRFDAGRPRLMRQGEIVSLSPKALEILSVLVQSGGTLVEKEHLISKVWPDTFVEEGNLSVHIFALRKALGQNSDGQSLIETVPRLGYRLRANVSEVDPEDVNLIVERHTISNVRIEEIEESPEVVNSTPVVPRLSAPRRSKTQLLGIVAICAVTLIAIVGVRLLLRARNPESNKPSGQVKSIAVLPLKSLSPANDDEYFRVGIADALITKLGSLRQLVVRPQSAVLHYANSTEDSLEIGRKLGVDAILEGTIQRENERIRVTVRLVSVKDESQLWSDRYYDIFTNTFGAQDIIAEKVAASLSLNLTAADRKILAKRYTQNTEAFHDYLLGRHSWNKRTDESTRKSIKYFKSAVDKDPLYALAYVGLAESYILSSYHSGASPREVFPKAKAAAKQALEIDPELAEASSVLAYIGFIYDWNFPEAEKDFQRSFDLNPNYATSRFWYGECLMYLGRFVEGIAQIKRAQELDPLSVVFSANLGWAYHIARNDDLAIEQLLKITETDQGFPMAYFYLGMSFEEKGIFDKAIDAYQKSAQLSGGYPGIAGLGHAYAMSGLVCDA